MKNLSITHQNSGNRSGSLLVEMVVCTVLLSVVAALLVPGIHAVHKQRKATRFEVLSLIELNNQCENLKLGDDAAPQLSEWFHKRYPSAFVAIERIQISPSQPDRLQPCRVTITRPATDSVPEESESVVCWLEKAGAPK